MNTYTVITDSSMTSGPIKAKSYKDAAKRRLKEIGLYNFDVIETTSYYYDMRVSGGSKVKFFKTVPVGSWIATDIQWDTDGERVELPKEVFIQYVNGACGTELCISDDEIVDFLSDTYGYCVQGYNLKYLEIQ